MKSLPEVKLAMRNGEKNTLTVNGVDMGFVESLTIDANRKGAVVTLKFLGQVEMTVEQAEVIAKHTSQAE